MVQLIDKSALIAEIERRRDLHYKYYMKNGAGSIAECKYDEDKEILSFINSLEVKEVDLNEEIEKCMKQYLMVAIGRKDFAPLPNTSLNLPFH